MKRALTLGSIGLVGLGIALMLAAAVFLVDYSRYLYLGLALLAAAFILRLVKHYLMRAAWPSRGGALVEATEHPIAYHLSFLVSVTIMALIVWVLIRAYIAA